MKATRTQPLLRSPRFPGVDPKVAAVSKLMSQGDASQDEPSPQDLDRAGKLVAQMAEARVGGEFWNVDADPWLETNAETPDGQLVRSLLDAQRALDVETRKRLAYDALLKNVAYRDPFTNALSTPEATIALLGFWRRQLERNPGYGGHTVAGVGIAGWKRAKVRQLLWAGTGSHIRFTQDPRTALRIGHAEGASIVAWQSRTSLTLQEQAKRADTRFYRVEDGFIRSVGLGAECFPPFSIVLDRSGAHYDPSRPSDLENILTSADFPPDLLARAEALVAIIVNRRISKYESGGEAALPPKTRRRVLVTGQVEDDLSVLLGGGNVQGNLDLLRRAREAEPDAEIWFKPHPDVDAGHRNGKISDRDALRYADQIIRNAPMAALFDAIDAIHVLTSLAGFEALLRGVEVIAHGIPFYAGWGLTRDLGKVPERRNRRLSLTELVAGVLLEYPRYLDPVTNLPCTPEILIDRLSEQKIPQQTWLTRLRHLQGIMRRMTSELRT